MTPRCSGLGDAAVATLADDCFSVITRKWTLFLCNSYVFLSTLGQQGPHFFPLERSSPRVEHIESLYVSGDFAFDPKTFYKKEVSKRHSYFLRRSKKVGPKATHPHSL